MDVTYGVTFAMRHLKRLYCHVILTVILTPYPKLVMRKWRTRVTNVTGDGPTNWRTDNLSDRQSCMEHMVTIIPNCQMDEMSEWMNAFWDCWTNGLMDGWMDVWTLRWIDDTTPQHEEEEWRKVNMNHVVHVNHCVHSCVWVQLHDCVRHSYDYMSKTI